MNSGRPSEPPEEPYQYSESAPLSPASPKPIHFPQPTNIPILELQHDVDHNQIERHMADPAMHNTEVRPDFWRDPNEPQEGDHASPYSTGGDAAEAAQDGTMHEEAEPVQAKEAADSTDTAANDTADPEPVQLSNTDSYQANAQLEAQPEPEATQQEEGQISSDPSVPASSAQVTTEPVNKPDDLSMNADEVTLDQAQAQPAPAFNGNVDVQALLDTLQVPPAASTVNATPVNGNVNPISPSQTQAQPAPPGVDTLGAAAALGLNASSANLGLPARPPPQEQPLIHPNYVHSQHIRDYHPHAAHPNRLCRTSQAKLGWQPRRTRAWWVWRPRQAARRLEATEAGAPTTYA